MSSAGVFQMVMLQQVSCGDDQELDDTMRNVLDRLRGLV